MNLLVFQIHGCSTGLIANNNTIESAEESVMSDDTRFYRISRVYITASFNALFLSNLEL